MSNFTFTNKKQQKHQTQESKSNCKIRKQNQEDDVWNYTFNSKIKSTSQSSQQITISNAKKIQNYGKTQLLYQLTERERQMISDLSKIFIAQNPHPKKILIKINEMKRCHLKNQNCEGCLNCRIDRIQISRLPDTTQTPRAIPQFKDVPQISGVLFDLKTSLNDTSVSQTKEIKSIKSEQNVAINKNMRILRTMAITYKPQYFVCDYSNLRSMSQAPFSKFRKHGRESHQSNVSIKNQIVLDQLVRDKDVSENDFAFIKLLDLNSFVKRKHQEKQMLTISNAANQKIMQQYHKLKDKSYLQRAEFKNKLQKLTKENLKVKGQLQSEKTQKSKLNEEITNLRNSLKQVLEIKQVLLRQNNTLKQKLKQNVRIIQQLRREVMKNHYTQQQRGEEKKQINLSRVNSSSAKIIQQVSKKALPSQKSYILQMDKTPNFAIQSTQSSPKLANVCSTHTINSGLQYRGDNGDINSKQGSIKSQRAIGIRKNSPKLDPNLIQQKNLVKIGNNYDADHHNSSTNNFNTSKNQRQDKSIKSISNYSEISSSLSQRVGYIQKPLTISQARRGMLVDYMLEDVAEKNDFLVKQGDKMSRQNKQTNIRNQSPRQRFQYKSIK